MKQFFRRQWFLVALAIVLLVGFSFSAALSPITQARILRNFVVAFVLFVMSISFRTDVIWSTIKRPWAALLASVINMGILPLVAWATSFALQGEMATGLLIAAAAPCTTASAAVWTRRAGGNDATAILVTILTNGTCFLFTPLWLWLTISDVDAVSISLPVKDMIIKLGLLVVLPMIVGQVLRINGSVANWATENKPRLGVAAQSGILFIVLAGAVSSGLKLRESTDGSALGGSVVDFVAMGIAVLAVHLSVLVIGIYLAKLLRVDQENRIAVGFAGSQKTLMVALHVAIEYFGGLSMLVPVCFHVGQLVADTLVADWFRRNRHGD